MTSHIHVNDLRVHPYGTDVGAAEQHAWLTSSWRQHRWPVQFLNPTSCAWCKLQASPIARSAWGAWHTAHLFLARDVAADLAPPWAWDVDPHVRAPAL